jgi:pSer/pThr/pTyr-binding forkhead associated (FHA) protein
LKCEFSVPLEDLSREHCLLELIDGDFYITDLNSSNGVWVDRERILPDERIKITPSSVVVLSNIYTLTINPTEIKSKLETNSNRKIDREIDTVSFQLDYPTDKKKKSKKINTSLGKSEEKSFSRKREITLMVLGFLAVVIYLVFEFILNN